MMYTLEEYRSSNPDYAFDRTSKIEFNAEDLFRAMQGDDRAGHKLRGGVMRRWLQRAFARLRNSDSKTSVPRLDGRQQSPAL